jgi:NADH-quinone oxidoreductase subunit F
MKLGDMDDSGRRRPVPIPGSNFVTKLDTLILAISERPDTSYIGEGDEIRRVGENIIIDEETGTTTRLGVFAGGDAVTGPNTVVEAMAAGKLAAESIARYLGGQPVQREYQVVRPSMYLKPVELTEEEAAQAKRPKSPSLPIHRRKKNFLEVELGLTEDTAFQEARRCLRCELETAEGKAAMGVQK